MNEPISVTRLPEPLLDPEQARINASLCLQCFPPPCVAACPAGIVIPRFIRMIRSGNLAGAAEVVRSGNPLAASCGLTCPDEELCTAACTRAALDQPIAIRRLHRFATEIGERRRQRAPVIAPGAAARVAVVGAGAAGLACAFELRRLGATVTLIERRRHVGGIPAEMIPLDRLPAAAIRGDAAWALGLRPGDLTGDQAPRKGRVVLRLEEEVEDITALATEFAAVFLAPGMSDSKPALPGADLRGVSTGSAFLSRCRRSRFRNRVGPAVAVIGGGNTAVDAARAALACGAARVSLLYRRRRAEMPAWDAEVRRAEEAGVVFHFLVAPLGFVGTRGRLTGIRLARTRLGAVHRGRPRPEILPESEFVMPCDQAIVATGMLPASRGLRGVPLTRSGHLRTGRIGRNIFAGGDAAGSRQTIVDAVADGKRGARAIAKSIGLPID